MNHQCASTTKQPHIPDVVTKQLAIGRVGDNRRVRISSNFLRLKGFVPGAGIVATPVPGLRGLQIETTTDDTERTHMVYERSYNRKGRSNNPFEAVIEFSGQGLVNSAFPLYTENFHVEMRDNRLLLSPLANRVFSIISKFRKSSPMHAFVAMTGGVDIHALESVGIRAEIVLEHRPQEARDVAAGRNLTEVNALNTLFNGSPSVVLNEDIHHLQIDRLAHYLAECPPIGLVHLSFGCDDASTLKSATDKLKSLDDLSTMVDMVYPALKQIELIQPAVIFLENVMNYCNSSAYDIFVATLRRLGYHITASGLTGTDFGSHQGRTRLHMVASVFPGFEMPDPIGPADELLWSVVERHISDCRDVSNTKTTAARASSNRASRPITRDSSTCGTIIKSQSRNTKDALYIEDEGKVLTPSEGLIKELMGIPPSFNSGWMAKEQSIELMGQSVDYKMHQCVMKAIHDHLELHCGKHSLIRYRNSRASAKAKGTAQ